MSNPEATGVNWRRNPLELVPANMDHQFMLRVVLAVHFVLISIALLGSSLPLSYFFYNAFLLAGFLWVLSVPAAESHFPLLKCIFINGFGVPMDIFAMVIGVRYSRDGFDQFSVAAVVFNFFFRFGAILILLRVRSERVRLRYEDWERGRGIDTDEPILAENVAHGSVRQYEIPPPSYSDNSFDTKPMAP